MLCLWVEKFPHHHLQKIQITWKVFQGCSSQCCKTKGNTEPGLLQLSTCLRILMCRKPTISGWFPRSLGNRILFTPTDTTFPSKTHKSHLLTYFSTAFYGFAPLELWAHLHSLSSTVFSACFHISLCHNFLPWEFPSHSLYTVACNSPILTCEKPRPIPSFLLPRLS